MPRILIFNGAPGDAQRSLVALGGPSNEEMFSTAVGTHAEPGEAMEFFSLNVADGERLPQGVSLADFDGVTITGSPLNIYSDVPAVRGQIEYAREVFNAGVPVFGACWGIQLMSAALGGKVRLNPNGREFGVARNITLNEAGREHPMYRGKPDAFDALCSHEDEVEALPACGRLLASNAMSRVQAAEMVDGDNSFWGVQYHPEFQFSLLATLFTARITRQMTEGIMRDPDDAAAMAADFRTIGENKERKDLAWRYGITRDILDNGVKTAEFRNWLEVKVRPYAAKRG